MRSTHLMFITLGCSALTAFACSGSGNGVEGEGNGGSTSFNPGSTGGAPINVSSGGSTAGGNSLQLPNAQDTADGRFALTSEQAQQLQTNASSCSNWQDKPQGGGAVIEYVIDTSGSMFQDPADPSDPNSDTKWQVFSQTLPSIFEAMPPGFAVGALYYGAQQNRCYTPSRYDVPIAMVSQTQLAALSTSVSRVQNNGWTPTYQAWEQGLENLTDWAPGPNDPASMATANRFVVLITDGVPTVGQASNCTSMQSGISLEEYEAELNLVQEQTDRTGVRTFVVGVVGSNDPQGASFDPLYMLSRWAVIGGTEQPAGCVPISGTPQQSDVDPRGSYCHYDLSTSTDLGASLAATLQAIASSVLSCTYQVPKPPPNMSIDPSKTILVYKDGATGESSIVLQNTSGTCDKGWHFTDGTNSQIEVCPSTCEAIQGNNESTMDLIFGCDAAVVLY